MTIKIDQSDRTEYGEVSQGRVGAKHGISRLASILSASLEKLAASHVTVGRVNF